MINTLFKYYEIYYEIANLLCSQTEKTKPK